MINYTDIDNANFEDMEPYRDSDVPRVLGKMSQHPLFSKLTGFLWPEMQAEELREKINRVQTVRDFQVEFMHSAIRKIVERSSDGLTYSGIENLNKNESYLYIANHRDIILDSAILQILLVENDFDTSEITFGNNLMDAGFITDLGKLNRMFTVQREGTSRELYNISKRLSAYIRHTITNKRVSVWIAQRSGRTKDGNDITQTGLLKMLNISGAGSFAENFSQLRIVPLTISYEYEPCDDTKVKEKYLSSMHIQYKKAPDEDMNSIISGVVDHKGRIHLAFGAPITGGDLAFAGMDNDNDRTRELTRLIDQQIYRDYRLWPVNYIAADLAENDTRYNAEYTPEDKHKFLEYINKKIGNMEGEYEVLLNLFISMYAYPVKNKMTYL
jgi:hypothetical protein